MATFYGALRTDSTMTANQATYSSIVGSNFEISAYSSITFNDGASTTQMAGDSFTNEQPNDPTQTMGGNVISWDYTIRVSDGTNTYDIGVIDYDINGDGDFDYPTAEQGYFLGFIGGIPPLNTTLTVQAIVNNSASIPVSSFVPCFVSGSDIKTATGHKQIDDLKVGDKIPTANNALEKIRWIGSRHISADELAANPKLRPVKIMAGALGNGLPKRDLLVSRQHRMLVKSQIAARMFGTAEVLIPAIKLIEMPGIFVDTAIESVEYFHVLFDKHEIIFSEGAPTESLYTGPEALNALSPDAKEEILALFPEVADLNYAPKPARQIPTGKLQKQLISRHAKNNKPLTSHSKRPSQNANYSTYTHTKSWTASVHIK